MYACVYAHIHTHTYTHTNVHIHIHTKKIIYRERTGSVTLERKTNPRKWHCLQGGTLVLPAETKKQNQSASAKDGLIIPLMHISKKVKAYSPASRHH